jgi:hypothetical protein
VAIVQIIIKTCLGHEGVVKTALKSWLASDDIDLAIASA